MCNFYIEDNNKMCYNEVLKGGYIMAYTQASNKAVQKYNKKTYDDLRIRVKKGQGDIIKAHAADMGESVNAFVTRAIDETMKNDKKTADE